MKKKIELSKGGAPKGAIRNPQGRNQHEGIYADRSIAIKLLKEDDEKLKAIAVTKPRGWTAEFCRQAIAYHLENFIQEEGIEFLEEIIDKSSDPGEIVGEGTFVQKISLENISIEIDYPGDNS